MEGEVDILIYKDKSIIINTRDLKSVKNSIYYDFILQDLHVLSDRTDDVYYTNNNRDTHAEIIDIDRIVHKGKLIEYTGEYALLEISNNVQLKIRNILSINIIKDNGTVLKFSKPGRKVITFTEPSIYYDLIYDIYTTDNFTTHLVQNIEIFNTSNRTKDFSSASIVIGRPEDKNQYRLMGTKVRTMTLMSEESYNTDDYPSALSNSSMNSQELEIIKLSSGNPVTLPKRANVNVTDITSLPGQRFFVIKSTNVGEPILYGFAVTPEINIYPAKARIMNLIEGKNIIIANIELKRMQKGTLGKIIVGPTMSIKPTIRINKNIMKVEEDEYKIMLQFHVSYENFNQSQALIYFEHEIEEKNFEKVDVNAKLLGNKVVWEDIIPKLSTVTIIYNLSYNVKEKQNKLIVM